MCAELLPRMTDATSHTGMAQLSLLIGKIETFHLSGAPWTRLMGPDWLGVSAITKELRQKMLVMLKADYGRSEKLQISRSERFCQAWKVVRSPSSLLWGTKYSSNRKFHLNHWWCWFLLPARVVTPWRSFVNPMKLSLPSECLTHSWNTCAGTLGANPTSCSCVFIGRNQTIVPKLK